MVRPATIEAVVLPPIDTGDWTREGLADEVQAIRQQYLDVLDQSERSEASDERRAMKGDEVKG